MNTPFPHYIVKLCLPDEVAPWLNSHYERGYDLESITPAGGNGAAFVVMAFRSNERRASYERRDQHVPEYDGKD